MPRTKIGNIEMYYEVHGSGEPIVLIHGLSMDSSTWFNQVPILSQKYQVVVFDNRGVGQTDAPHGFAGQVAALMKHDTRSRISQISVPTLVLIGGDDIFIPIEFSEELAGKIPKAELVALERGGHNCWMEFPELFNQAVMQFLDGVTSM